MHFSVAVDVLLIAVGLFCIAVLSYALPITTQGILTGKYAAFVNLVWNMTSLIAIAAATGIAIFAPETKLNRRRTKIWLMFALVCQSILGLLPNPDAMATLIRLLWPGWLAIAVLIFLLHVESRIRTSDWRALAETVRKPSPFQRTKMGFTKLASVVLVAVAIFCSLFYAIHLAEDTQTQLASRSWTTTDARLLECDALESDASSKPVSYTHLTLPTILLV